MKPCRECQHEVSDQAQSCPAKEEWNGYGFEYKSKATLFGLPLVHISFKYRANRCPVPARGVLAIGQFACGIITVSQFGIGVISISQITLAGYALSQIAFAYKLIAQIGIFLAEGHGQKVWQLTEFFN